MKKPGKFKTIALVLVTIVTLILGGIAVVTALKLRQLATVPVAPTAPESQPRAAEDNIPVNQACQTSFTVEATPSAVLCDWKKAYLGANELTGTSTVSPGDTITYKIKLTSASASSSASITVTDVLNTNLTYKSSDSICSHNATNRTLSCTTTDPNATITFDATVNAAASGAIGNTATVNPGSTNEDTCAVDITVKRPGCNSACSTTAGSVCEGEYVCHTGYCRNSSCLEDADCVCATPTPTPTPTATPTGCNSNCTVDADCSGDYICYTGKCRNAACQTSATCACASAPTPTPAPTLPQAGNTLPTVAIILVGLGIITFGVVSMLGL